MSEKKIIDSGQGRSTLTCPDQATIAKSKSTLRLHAAALRNQLTAEQKNGLSERACGLMAERGLGQAKTVAAYRATSNELNLDRLINWMLSAGLKVICPRVGNGRLLEMCSVSSLHSGWEIGPWGILQPTGPALTDLAGIDAYFIPGAAFDLQGGRLGWGKGYFDETLRHADPESMRIGVAFSCQVVDSVPMGPGDETMHLLLTEQELRVCRTGLGHETFVTREGPIS